ncbi:MAG: HAD family hydrolase [Methanophagales archaeon]|nr:HAD family hydrolase [Methanophagales archaeon]
MTQNEKGGEEKEGEEKEGEEKEERGGRVPVSVPELAVVFDGAGVLYAPFRIIKNMARGVTKRSRVSGLTCTDRLEKGALAILKTRYEETMENETGSKFLSDLMREKKIESKVVYKKKGVSDEEVVEVILGDKNVRLRDVHETMSFLRRCDIIPVIGVGLIAEVSGGGAGRDRVGAGGGRAGAGGGRAGAGEGRVGGGIKYVIAGGINFFSGTLKLLKDLREMGVSVFVASGDRIEREEMAAYLPDVPPENLFGMMKPEDKRDLVRRLKEKQTVVMVGDDRNDYLAMCEADISVLSLQEEADRPGAILEVADFRIKKIGEVKGIIEEMRECVSEQGEGGARGGER